MVRTRKDRCRITDAHEGRDYSGSIANRRNDVSGGDAGAVLREGWRDPLIHPGVPGPGSLSASELDDVAASFVVGDAFRAFIHAVLAPFHFRL